MNTAASDARAVAVRHTFIVAAVALAAALVMIVLGFRVQRFVANEGDPYHYGEIAREFVEHGFTKLTRRGASLYPEFIAVVYRTGLGDRTVELFQAFFHTGTCLLVLALGRRLYNERTAFLAGMLTALHPMLLRYVSDLHMETSLTLLCTLTVWCAVRLYARPVIANGVLFGAVGMITTLTKGVMLPYVLLVGAICFVQAWRRWDARMLKATLAVGVTMAVLLGPWTYRNYRVTGGRFVALTPGASDSFLRGYVFSRKEFALLQKPPYTDAENEVNAWFRQIARDAGTEWERDEVVDEANNASVARQLIVTQPLDTVRKIAVGLFTFWYEMTNLKNSLVAGALALAAWALAFVGWRRARREGRPSWPLVLPIVVMNVFVAILTSLGRSSVPILPCLIILAAFGVDTMLGSPGAPTGAEDRVTAPGRR